MVGGRSFKDTSWAASMALVKIGQKAPQPVILALKQALGDDWDDATDVVGPRAAALALGDMGYAAVEAIPELRKALTHVEARVLGALEALYHKPVVGEAAAKALGKLGDAAVAAVPDLCKAWGSVPVH